MTAMSAFFNSIRFDRMILKKTTDDCTFMGKDTRHTDGSTANRGAELSSSSCEFRNLRRLYQRFCWNAADVDARSADHPAFNQRNAVVGSPHIRGQRLTRLPATDDQYIVIFDLRHIKIILRGSSAALKVPTPSNLGDHRACDPTANEIYGLSR
jgi:hypothetical protein